MMDHPKFWEVDLDLCGLIKKIFYFKILVMNVYLWVILMIQSHVVKCFFSGIALDFSVTSARNDQFMMVNCTSDK